MIVQFAATKEKRTEAEEKCRFIITRVQGSQDSTPTHTLL
jgi:hypothetical protein